MAHVQIKLPKHKALMLNSQWTQEQDQILHGFSPERSFLLFEKYLCILNRDRATTTSTLLFLYYFQISKLYAAFLFFLLQKQWLVIAGKPNSICYCSIQLLKRSCTYWCHLTSQISVVKMVSFNFGYLWSHLFSFIMFTPSVLQGRRIKFAKNLSPILNGIFVTQLTA